MNIQQAYEKLKKLVNEGHGSAVLVHTDTRSGVTERCHVGSLDAVDGTENDFYVDLKLGEEYLSVYEGD